MHASSHWFDHLGEDLAHTLKRQWAAFRLWVADRLARLPGWDTSGPSDAETEIQWDSGEPEDKL